MDLVAATHYLSPLPALSQIESGSRNYHNHKSINGTDYRPPVELLCDLRTKKRLIIKFHDVCLHLFSRLLVPEIQ